jgi:Zn-dependent protease
VGVGLLILAATWLWEASSIDPYLYSGGGIALALLVHHFGFLKIVDKNLKRLRRMDGKRCVFAFIPWKSYLIIVVMVAMGALLRHSAIPKKDLAILYIGIGLALILSSVRYARVFYKAMINRKF